MTLPLTVPSLLKFYFKKRPIVYYLHSLHFVDYEKAVQLIQTTLSNTFDSVFSLDCHLDLQNKEMVRSIGCLLTFLPSLLSHDHFEGDTQVSVYAFRPLSIPNYMHIDRVSLTTLVYAKTTLHSLDIFSTVNHPSLIKGLGREKQGFTMYSLLDQKVLSPLGKRLLKQFVYTDGLMNRWVIAPLNNQQEIESRQDVIAFYQQPQLQELKRTLIKEMKRLSDIPSVSKRICVLKESVSDWLHLIDSVAALIEIGRVTDMMIRYTEKIPELIQLAPSLLQSEDLRQLFFFLQQVFDTKNKDVTIRSGVDITLDEMRSLYSSMPSLLEDASEQTRRAILSEAGEYEFLPRSSLPIDSSLVGYVFAMPIEYKEAVPPAFQYQFHTEDCVYFKTDLACSFDEVTELDMRKD